MILLGLIPQLNLKIYPTKDPQITIVNLAFMKAYFLKYIYIYNKHYFSKCNTLDLSLFESK